MKILLLSVSAGAGHVRAAQALEETARKLYPRDEIRNVDILDFVTSLYKKSYAGSYLRMIDNAPALWGYLYQKTNRVKLGGLDKKLSRIYDKIEFAKFRGFVREFQPDVILSTHFLAAQVFAPYRKKGRDLFPLGLVVTDFDVHAFWVEPTVDRYFVGNEELRTILSGKGIDEKKIEVTGIPIIPAFSKSYDRAAIRKNLGLSEKIPTLLVMSGGAGVGSMEETVIEALGNSPVQILAVAGRNEKLKQKLDSLKVPAKSKLLTFGFVNTIAELMSVSDLAISKSGGLTTSECLAMGLPMIVRDPVPGQEDRNCDFLMESGAGVKAHGVESLRHKLAVLLSNPEKRKQMSEAAKRVGKPNAASDILKKMLS